MNNSIGFFKKLLNNRSHYRQRINQNPNKPHSTNNIMLTLIFLIAAIIITASIYLKTHKISKLSSHQGIRLTNQAFFLFALAYIISLLAIISPLSISKASILQALSVPIKTYLFTAAALYLSASLFWKDSKHDKAPLHIITLLVVILNNFTNILPLALTAIYTFTSIQAYTNYQTKKTKFSQVHLISIALLTLANLILTVNYSLLTTQLMTITAFSIFLYGTLKTIK